ncbi:Outer membrane protein (porin) [Rhodoferax sp. OV413]|uniref:porin n=1 Tax=Rhodoferax sp. OV413 TaxID=1855285 RepID=UPI00088B76DC|nr:porin [Rhodoferax sp. OV413]SDP91948.1 Outer membrane protein (porin) [Rhodoferax sp. OV413]
MKKSLIALAVLAASGAAMAQSTVTLYGIVDVYFGSTKTDNGTTSLRQTKIDSGLVNGSRWGLRGSEDLGGGLTANFKLEQGFSIDTGVARLSPAFGATAVAATATTAAVPAASTAFSRQAYVGLSGSFGETRLGFTTTPFDDYSGASDAIWDSALSPMNSTFRSIAYNPRPGNTIFYATPSFSGLTASVSYSLGENKTATVGAGSVSSFAVAYANGPIAAHLAYQNEKSTGAVTAKKYTRLGGTYDFGVVKALATYGKAENIGNLTDADANDYQLGLDVPVGAALTLSTSFARSKDNATAGNVKRTGLGLGAKYTLSKRTFLTAGYEADTSKLAGRADIKHDLFAIGMQHRF